LVFGIIDDPDHQSQPPVAYQPDVVGNLLVYGAGGSGKSTLMRSLAVAAGMGYMNGPTNVYGLDFSARGLAMLEVCPHVGSIINGADDERVQRLLRWLRSTIDERAARYSAVNASTVAEYRRLANRPDEPRILLLVDGLAAFRQNYEAAGKYRFWDLFVAIAGEGRPVGVNVVISHDQHMGIPPALLASIQQRIVMRMASEDDYASLGVPKDILTPDSSPGRCLVGGLEGQVAVLGDDEQDRLTAGKRGIVDDDEAEPPTDAQSQAANLEIFAGVMERAGIPKAPEIRHLPEQIALGTLKARPGTFALGVESADFATVEVDISGPFILAGPPGSGISTALETIALGIIMSRSVAEIHILSDRPTELSKLKGLTSVTIGADLVAEKAKELSAHAKELAVQDKKIAVLIESLPDFSSTPAEYAINDMVQSINRAMGFILVSGDPTSLNSCFSMMGPFKAGRRGMFLQFDSTGPELVQAVYPRTRSSDFPEGRGVYAYRGRTLTVQVALPVQRIDETA
jgi:S-DNA-T family DNA segregation ATPase FtsK/SpoIIIE